MSLQLPRRAAEVERQPLPAYRDQEHRATVLTNLAGTILRYWPALAEDVEQLVTPPPIDEWSYLNDFGLYGGNQEHIVRAIIANDIVATEAEMRNAFGLVGVAPPERT